MAAIETLALWGVLRAPEAVELAAAVGLELAAAAVLLEKESGGGRNVWGSDAVQTGGFYAKGGPVTRENYTAWKPNRARLGSQGVGPCQLTWSGYQDQADQLGGCWDWRNNVRVGFAALVQLQRQYGVREGFRRYNGSGAAAERYADDAMAKLARWQTRLGGTAPSPSPTLNRDEVDMATLDELRQLVREEIAAVRDLVWQAPIDDVVQGGKAQAWQHLQWAAGNAAYARGAAEHAAKLLDEQPPAGELDPDTRYRLIAE